MNSKGAYGQQKVKNYRIHTPGSHRRKGISFEVSMRIPAAKAAEHEEWDMLKNLPAWSESKVRAKGDVNHEAQNKKAPVHFEILMHLCHLKHSEIGSAFAKVRKTSRASRRHDTKCQAVVTEQRASASQMIAAKVLD